MTAFFRSLPISLLQSAQVDGATPFQSFYLILLPLTAPALVTTGLLAFIAAAVIVTIPLILLVFIFQKKIVAGLTAGAVKG